MGSFLPESRDVRASAVGGRIVVAVERTARSGFKSSYAQGGGVRPFECTPCGTSSLLGARFRATGKAKVRLLAEP